MTQTTTTAYAREVYPTQLRDEVEESFLAYALSVITSRALPDVRDGLKPVQRRILFAMHEQRFYPEGQYRKCGAVVGDVLGKYHPHGDGAIYEALVRLAQPWSLRLPLVDPHGNFGSEDDGPAASRYTECKMAHSSVAMIGEIDEESVDFRPNFEGSREEPVVLPSLLPNLLLNGVTGIAVGMATNIPPHNLGELTNAITALVQNPEIDIDGLMEHIQGPDFPTGGFVIADDEGGLRKAYETGSGKFLMRGKADIVDLTPRKKGIEITELPYNVGPEKFIEQCNAGVTSGKLVGLTDITDYSARGEMKIVVSVKAGINATALLAKLYKDTSLETSFSVNANALVNGAPRILSLKEMLSLFVDHRLEVIVRRSEFRLAKAQARLHILEGLIKALNAIDQVIDIIRNSKDADTARKGLKKALKLSDVQTEKVLETPLRRLTALEVGKLKEEAAELQTIVDDLTDLLGDEARRRVVLCEELADVSEQFGTPRRSTMLSSIQAAMPEVANDLVEVGDEPCRIQLNSTGLIGRLGLDPWKGRRGSKDIVVSQGFGRTREDFWLVTSDGTLIREVGYTITTIEDKNRGAEASAVFSGYENHGQPVAVFGTQDFAEGQQLCIVTRTGAVKRLDPKHFKAKAAAVPAINLKAPGDAVVSAFFVKDDTPVGLLTSDARFIKFPASKVSSQGRAGGGVRGMRVNEGAEVIAAGAAVEGTFLVTVTNTGQTKHTPASEFPEKGRGGGGVRCHKFRKDDTEIVVGGLWNSDDVTHADGSAVATVGDIIGKRDGAGALVEPVATGIGILRS